MTDEAQERLNSWVRWGLQSVLAAVIGWMAWNVEASRQKAEDQSAVLIRLEARVEALAVMTADRYTLSHARADWSREELVNEQLRDNINRIDARYNQWNSNLSERLRNLEQTLREKDEP